MPCPRSHARASSEVVSATGTEKIAPVLARLEDYYGILGRMPKKMIQSRLLETYREMAETRLFGAFGREQCRRIQENRKPEYDQEKAEDLLAVADPLAAAVEQVASKYT